MPDAYTDHPRPSPDDPAQERVREWYLTLGGRPWLTLYSSNRTEGINCGTFCALAPVSYRGEAVRDPGWDLLHGRHGPGFSQDGAGVATYQRYYSDPLEPLVVERDFHGIRGIWPYETAHEHYPEFIIGADEFGRPTRFTCDPSELANFFGANPGAPNYLTPVHFRRDVLVKYYDRPDLYTVEDGYLRCRGLWGLRMDNDTSETVVVWLGDLGRDLPELERDYWMSFNIPPAGDISETAYRRAILGQFAAAQSSDLRFRVAYEQLRSAWRDRFGWPLFLDPQPGDAHLLDQVRRPLHNTDAELEELVADLAKLLVDFLNEAELARPLPPGPSDEKGISKLNRWLSSNRYPDTEADIEFLRALQSVRSKAVAHRKGSDYDKAMDRLFEARRRAAAGDYLLERSVKLLTSLLEFAGRTT